MKAFSGGSLIATLGLLAACASVVGPSGRFLQVRHPVSDAVVAQITYPTKEGCSAVLKAMAFGNNQARQAQSLMSCRDSPESVEMRAIATMRDKLGSFTFDIETKTEAICKAFIVELYDSNKETYDIVSTCKVK